MNANNLYPAKYKNLLIKAGLIGNGIKVINAYHNDKKRITMDEESLTWMEMNDEFEIDYRDASEILCVSLDANSAVNGDWKQGLTTEEIALIRDECSVPEYKQNSALRLYHGKQFDLSIPKDMADYRVFILGTDQVAKAKTSMFAGQRFYITSHEDEQIERQKQRTALKEALKLEEQLTIAQKRSLLHLVNYELKLGLSGQQSDVDVTTNFSELVYDPQRYPELVRINKFSDKPFRLILYQCLERGILFQEGVQGKISRPNGVIIANDTNEAIEALKKDQGLKEEFERKLASAQSIQYAKTSEENASDLQQVRAYDTNIHDVEELKYWNIEACMQYFSDRDISTTLKSIDSIDRWRKAVLEHHEKGGEQVVITDLGIKERLSDRITRMWTKQQCSDFMLRFGGSEVKIPTRLEAVRVFKEGALSVLALTSEEQLKEFYDERAVTV